MATERPSFTTISSDLNHMAGKPTRHILLKATKDHAKPGHISENGQVFLRSLPSNALDEEVPQKKAQRSSGTMRSLISSIDDTVYTRETVETVLDLTQSETETENYNNYERYLKGDISLPLKALYRRSYDETDTSGNDGNTTQERRLPSKLSQETSGDNADAVSAGKASGGAGSGRKKKRRSSSGKEKRKTPGYANKMFSPPVNTSSPVEGDSVSSDGAPSITDHEEEKVATSDMSGSDLGGSQAGSQAELVTTSNL